MISFLTCFAKKKRTQNTNRARDFDLLNTVLPFRTTVKQQQQQQQQNPVQFQFKKNNIGIHVWRPVLKRNLTLIFSQ